MKQYKLRQPLPGLSTGSIFEETKKGYRHQVGLDVWVEFPKDFVEDEPIWFEEVPAVEVWNDD